MCLNNINANISIFGKSDTEDKNDILEPINKINAVLENNKKFLKNIIFTINMTLLETKDSDRLEENVINQKGKLECILRLVKETNDGYLAMKLDEYILDFSDQTNFIIEKSRDMYFCNISRTINFGRIYLREGNDVGKFTVELLLKRIINEKYIDEDGVLQTLLNFEVI